MDWVGRVLASGTTPGALPCTGRPTTRPVNLPPPVESPRCSQRARAESRSFLAKRRKDTAKANQQPSQTVSSPRALGAHPLRRRRLLGCPAQNPTEHGHGTGAEASNPGGAGQDRTGNTFIFPALQAASPRRRPHAVGCETKKNGTQKARCVPFLRSAASGHTSCTVLSMSDRT